MSNKFAGVILCAVTQNLALGIIFGSFGPLLPQTMARFGISLVTATMAMSVATLAIAIGAPAVGVIVQRLTPRLSMTLAALLSACCYAIIALSPSFLPVLACYAILGVCAVTLGIIGPVTLVNQWFEAGRGKMLGFIHMPLLLVLVPVAVAEILPILGRSGIFLIFAALFLLIVPFILRFAQASTPFAAEGNEVQPAIRHQASGLRADAARRRMLALVLLSVAVGVVSGGSVVYMAHVVPFGLQRGLALPSASLLISLYSGLGVVGSPITGWMADRVGPYWTLAGAAFFIALLWFSLPMVDGVAIFAVASMLGFFAAPINTMHAAALSAIYGPSEVGKAMGASYLIKLPILAGLTPLVALIFDRFGSYREAFGLIAGLTLIACLLHIVVMLSVRRLEGARMRIA